MSADPQLRPPATDLRILDEGQGAPVLLLHGFPDRAELWRHVTPPLRAAGFRTLAVDLPGFGESPAPLGPHHYHAPRVATRVLGALDRIGVGGPVDVVGHDWGAFLGWVLCLRHPDRVRRHVALSVGHPAAFRRAGLEQQRRSLYMLVAQVPWLSEKLVSRDDFAGLRASFGRRHPDIEQVLGDLRRPGRLSAGLSWYRANLLPSAVTRWPSCDRPTLGVWSSEDRYLGERQMQGSARYVTADWRYERIDGAGHWPMLEAPERVTPLLLDWLGV